MSGFEEIAKTVILLGALLGALGVLGVRARRGWKKTVFIFARLEAVADLAEAQLTVNGGTSLLDKVNKIEANHEVAELHWTGLEDSMSVAQDIGEKRWMELADKADTIAADLLAHRASVQLQHEGIIGRLDIIEGRLQ